MVRYALGYGLGPALLYLYFHRPRSNGYLGPIFPVVDEKSTEYQVILSSTSKDYVHVISTGQSQQQREREASILHHL